MKENVGVLEKASKLGSVATLSDPSLLAYGFECFLQLRSMFQSCFLLILPQGISYG